MVVGPCTLLVKLGTTYCGYVKITVAAAKGNQFRTITYISAFPDFLMSDLLF